MRNIPQKAERPNKLIAWFRAFLDENNPTTFLNKTASARAAGYRCTTDESFRAVGYQNFIKCHVKIKKWIEEAGLSDARLKQKLLALIEAKRIVTQKVKGHISDAGFLHQDAFEIVKTHVMAWEGRGEAREAYDAGETVIGIRMDDPEIQRRTLDMAFKVKGTYAPEKRELSGKDGKPLQIITLIPEPLLPEDDPNSPTYIGTK
jgi:hypothetical protein